MARTRIKICGIRDEDGRRAAVKAGADAVGFVLAEGSPRTVAFGKAAALATGLPPFVTPVAVVRDQPMEALLDWPFATMQLHGAEDEAYVNVLNEARPDAVIIRAIAFDPGSMERWAGVDAVDAILVDAPTPGSGEAFDHAPLAAIAAEYAKPIILAGGLSPETVAAAIRAVRPWAVDVSSGVEREKGVKDPSKMAAFCEAVRAVDAELNVQPGAAPDHDSNVSPPTDSAG